MTVRLRLDYAGEKLVGVADLITPISFTVTPQGMDAVAYPAVKREAEEFLRRYAQAPVSQDALTFLRTALAPYIKNSGYREERFLDRYVCIFHADKTPAAHIKARALQEKDQNTNKTTRQIEEILKNNHLAYGVFEDEKLVSVAYTHTLPTAPFTEVGVETTVGARGNGYATAALIALTNDLHTSGVIAEYRAFCTNIPSRRVALAAGYIETGSFYRYTGRRGR